MNDRQDDVAKHIIENIDEHIAIEEEDGMPFCCDYTNETVLALMREIKRLQALIGE